MHDDDDDDETLDVNLLIFVDAGNLRENFNLHIVTVRAGEVSIVLDLLI